MREVGPCRVERVDPEITADLRARVLRPGRPPASVRWPELAGPAAATFAAFPLDADAPGPDARVRPVSTVTVYPDPCPWRSGTVGAWRLRAMATEEDRRGQGVGRLVLDTALAHVAGEGGSLVWCHARRVARRFYERAGFAVVGEEFEIEGIGPHWAMAVHLRPVGAASVSAPEVPAGAD